MANIYSGSNGIVYVGTTAIASIRSFSFEETQETIDATTMNTAGVAFRTNKATFKSWSGSVDVFWTTETETAVDGFGPTTGATDMEKEAGAGTVADGSSDLNTPVAQPDLMGILQPGDQVVTLHFWPAGDANDGDLGYTGECIITGRTISSSVDGMVEASITVLGTAPITTETKGWTGNTIAAT